MNERILRLPDGTLVLQGIVSVGITNAVNFSHSYPPTSFPQVKEVPEVEETFWGAVAREVS